MDIMNIEIKLTEGCDKLSGLYGKMFVFLKEVMEDKDRLRELSPLDYSALGLYMGKFVEQEINSSVVQLMRAYMGVEMPDYYCKYKPFYKCNVTAGRKTVMLNLHPMGAEDPNLLATISLGDAYHVFGELKEGRGKEFFSKYSWLNDRRFLNVWKSLFDFRNRVAHIGEIIDAKTLEENYEQFFVFLEYMPWISKLKQELAPVGYRQSLRRKKRQRIGKPYVRPTEENRNREGYEMKRIGILTDEIAFAPHNIKPVEERLIVASKGKGPIVVKISKERYGLRGHKDDIKEKRPIVAKMFKERYGLRGLKDDMGHVIVPPMFEDFGFLPIVNGDSVIAIRDGKYVVVTLDGTGKVLTKEKFDEMGLADRKLRTSPYVYRHEGSIAWGFMDRMGNVMCDPIVDNYYCEKGAVWMESRELWGYWNFAKPHQPFIPPIYDSIEAPWGKNNPLVFTLNGEEGFVRMDGVFIPRSGWEALSEEDRRNTFESCICEE